MVLKSKENSPFFIPSLNFPKVLEAALPLFENFEAKCDQIGEGGKNLLYKRLLFEFVRPFLPHHSPL
jgi:hypothetical protein